MGFKDDVRAKAEEFERDLTDLKGRVRSLEGVANDLRRSRGESLPVRAIQGRSSADTVETYTANLPTRTPGASLTDDLPREAVSTNTASRIDRRFALDYPAVAFGLSEIKREVAVALNASGVSAQTLTSKFAGTVQYFADVFAKNDPEFNEAEFKRQAGA